MEHNPIYTDIYAGSKMEDFEEGGKMRIWELRVWGGAITLLIEYI